MRPINIGLSDEQRQGVIDLLNHDLADAYLLLVKTKKFHWDIVGPQFLTLHKLWEEHYNTLTENIDACAERVRSLGGYPIGTMKGFLSVTSLSEHPGDVPMATGMVDILIGDHEQVIRNMRDHIDRCSDDFHDQGTADFLTGLMEQHEQIAWMLRSFIEGEALVANGERAGLAGLENKAKVSV
jgi:starvation-inducible DNA-binding protein